MNEKYQRPLNGDAQYALFELIAMTHAVEDVERDLKRNLSPEQKKKVKTIGTYAHNTVMEILAKQHPDQVRRFAALSKQKSFKVVTNPVGTVRSKDDPAMTLIGDDSLKIITTKAMEQCDFCDRKGMAVDICPLKKALDKEMLCETSDPIEGSCWYRGL